MIVRTTFSTNPSRYNSPSSLRPSNCLSRRVRPIRSRRLYIRYSNGRRRRSITRTCVTALTGVSCTGVFSRSTQLLQAKIVLSEKLTITTNTDRMDRGALDQLLLHVGTLGNIYHKNPEVRYRAWHHSPRQSHFFLVCIDVCSKRRGQGAC